MIITAKVNTVLKAKLAPSEQLMPSEKRTIHKGKSLKIKKLIPVTSQDLLLELIDDKLDRAYVYAPHWEYEKEEITLPVNYYYQTDNPSGYGFRECCGTSNAMMLNYLLNGYLETEAKLDKLSQPEAVYLNRLAEYGDTTDHDANTRAIKSFGVDSYWSTSLTLEDYYKSIRNGIPLVLGLDYKGPDNGHIVCGVGFNTKAKIVVHDPYGARQGATDYWINNGGDITEAGKFDVYGLGTFEALWFPSGSLGWGRIVTHINGLPTAFA